MGKFALYNIPLRGLTEGSHTFDYLLDNQFFKLINDTDSDLKRGKVNVQLTVKRKINTFDFSFSLEGEVFVPCDRCLDDIAMEINTENRLIVKFGKEYSEENDEIVIIPEEDGEINIAWFLYEFISLALPMKHVHAPGKCNKIMSTKLNKHRVDSAGDESDDLEEDNEEESSESNDPRWDNLKDVSFDE